MGNKEFHMDHLSKFSFKFHHFGAQLFEVNKFIERFLLKYILFPSEMLIREKWAKSLVYELDKFKYFLI